MAAVVHVSVTSAALCSQITTALTFIWLMWLLNRRWMVVDNGIEGQFVNGGGCAVFADESPTLETIAVPICDRLLELHRSVNGAGVCTQWSSHASSNHLVKRNPARLSLADKLTDRMTMRKTTLVGMMMEQNHSVSASSTRRLHRTDHLSLATTAWGANTCHF